MAALHLSQYLVAPALDRDVQELEELVILMEGLDHPVQHPGHVHRVHHAKPDLKVALDRAARAEKLY